jgi:hypothetical protein
MIAGKDLSGFGDGSLRQRRGCRVRPNSYRFLRDFLRHCRSHYSKL